MNFFIRDAVDDDYESIHLLNLNGLGYDYSKEQTKQRLAQMVKSTVCKIMIAECNGVIAGYIHAEDYEVTYSDSLKNILAIAVDDRFRRNGIGRALLSAVETWAKETGAVGIRLNSSMARTKAHVFYETCGYVNRKDQKNYVKIFNE